MPLLPWLVALVCIWVTLFSLWYTSQSLASYICELMLHHYTARDSWVTTCNVIPPSVKDTWGQPVQSSCLIVAETVGLSGSAQVRGTSAYETLGLSNEDIRSLHGIW